MDFKDYENTMISDVAYDAHLRAGKIVSGLDRVMEFVPHGPAHAQINALKEIQKAAENLKKISIEQYNIIMDKQKGGGHEPMILIDMRKL